MLANTLPFAIFTSFALLAGCSANDAASSDDASMDAQEIHAAPGTCIQELPVEVWSYDAHLELGRPVATQQVGDTTTYVFTSAATLEYTPRTKKVVGVHVKAKQGPDAGKLSPLDLTIAAAAEANELGQLLGSTGAAGTATYTFARGTITSGNGIEVQRTDGAEPALASKPPVYSAGDVCLNDVPAKVWSIAAHLDLGPVVSTQAGVAKTTYGFGDKSTILWDWNRTEVIEAKLLDTQGDGKGKTTAIKPAIVLAATEAALGRFHGETGGGGYGNYLFDRGAVVWNQNLDKLQEIWRPEIGAGD